MTKILIDSSAWIEYLNSGAFGKKIEAFFEKNECFTSSIVLGEVVSKVKRMGFNEQIAIDAILCLSKVIPVDWEISIEAGRFHAEQRKLKPQFSLGDAYIYCCAKKIDAKILTKDHHFEDFKEAIMLKP